MHLRAWERAYGRPFVSKLVMTTLCKKWVTSRDKLLASRDNCDTLRDYCDTSRDITAVHRVITVIHRVITVIHRVMDCRAITAVTSRDVIQHRATTPHNDIALLGRDRTTTLRCPLHRATYVEIQFNSNSNSFNALIYRKFGWGLKIMTRNNKHE